jgi:hypothetical protein
VHWLQGRLFGYIECSEAGRTTLHNTVFSECVAIVLLAQQRHVLRSAKGHQNCDGTRSDVWLTCMSTAVALFTQDLNQNEIRQKADKLL